MAITTQMYHSLALPPMSTANQLSGTPTTIVLSAKPSPGLLPRRLEGWGEAAEAYTERHRQLGNVGAVFDGFVLDQVTSGT